MFVVKPGSDDELDAFFDLVDSDSSNSITFAEWQDFVSARKKANAFMPCGLKPNFFNNLVVYEVLPLPFLLIHFE